LVAITDNADPMNVVVYNSVTGAQTCKVPVFSKGGSATENSLIGWGTSTKSSLIVENNYGYVNPYYVGGGSTTKPGVTKIDVTNKGKTCKVAWKNTTLSAPTLVPKVSLGNGLLYLYTKPKTTNKAESWFWTAVDASTGKQVWSKFAGTGLLRFNNNYAAVHIGPDHALYMGLLGGVARLADGS
jgi:preprotein translocase subunit Sec61beta